MMIPAADEVELWVDDWQAGADPEGNFRRLFDRYSAILFAFFRKRGLSPEQCEDLVQETFLAVHNGLGGFRREVPFASWLFELAANAFRKGLRRKVAGKRRGYEESLDGWRGSSHSTQQPAAAVDTASFGQPPWTPQTPSAALRGLLGKEKLRAVLEGLDQLPAQMRRCAILGWCDGYSNHQIAALLQISPQTVKVHQFKARKRLRERLKALLKAV
ncbi:MAG: sigma-70 family RNA polymerase sigma factor [bacterium]|nr:sigma-70 family RNA polymerase sigma factor [bacterium]